MINRIAIIALGVIIIYSSLIFNIYNLQIEKGEYYSARAESQYRLAGLLEPKRGNIYFTDKNNNLIPAALNKLYPVVFAVPEEIKDIDGVAQLISRILNLDPEAVRNSLSKPNDLYELLLAKASESQIAEIENVDLAGIYVEKDNFRFYPF